MKAQKFEEVSKATNLPYDIIGSCFEFIRENPEREKDFLESTSADLELLYNLWKKGVLFEVEDSNVFTETTEFYYILNEELFDIMNNYSPDDCYFGSHIGDGSLLGYWPSEDLD